MSYSKEMELENGFLSFRDDYSEGYLSDDDEGDDETASRTSDSSEFFNESSYQEQYSEDLINSEDDVGNSQSSSNQSESNTTVITEKEICQRVGALRTVTSSLSVSQHDPAIFLRSLKSSVSTMTVCKGVTQGALRRLSVGLATNPYSLDNRVLLPQEDLGSVSATNWPQPIACPLCFEAYLSSRMVQVSYCGHFSYEACWKGHIHHPIRIEPACLMSPAKCKAVFGCGGWRGTALAPADEEDRSMPPRHRGDHPWNFKGQPSDA